MELSVGQPAPTFQARSDDGRSIDLEAYGGQWVVLYFYPRASTPGCSVEAQRFEQSLGEFERCNAQVIGVSTDTEARQAQFREKCGLSFPLLPDSDKSIAKQYSVLGGVSGLLGLSQRQTFLIDPQGNLAYIWRKVNPVSHAIEVLARLQLLQMKTEDTVG